MDHALIGERVKFVGHEDDVIEGYLARPLGPGPFPGVVLIHAHLGWDELTNEWTRRFAERGYLTISPHLFSREGEDASPEDAAAAARAFGRNPDARMLGDVAGAIRVLKMQPSWNGKIGVIGFCSGGRDTYIVACNLDIDAAIDCYGGNVVQETISERQPVSPIEMTPGLSCPLLGLFGEEDDSPSPEQVATIEAELKRLGKDYEFHVYKNTDHGFFGSVRAHYVIESANDGWRRIFAFFAKHLQGEV